MSTFKSSHLPLLIDNLRCESSGNILMTNSSLIPTAIHQSDYNKHVLVVLNTDIISIISVTWTPVSDLKGQRSNKEEKFIFTAAFTDTSHKMLHNQKRKSNTVKSIKPKSNTRYNPPREQT